MFNKIFVTRLYNEMYNSLGCVSQVLSFKSLKYIAVLMNLLFCSPPESQGPIVHSFKKKSNSSKRTQRNSWSGFMVPLSLTSLKPFLLTSVTKSVLFSQTQIYHCYPPAWPLLNGKAAEVTRSCISLNFTLLAFTRCVKHVAYMLNFNDKKKWRENNLSWMWHWLKLI